MGAKINLVVDANKIEDKETNQLAQSLTAIVADAIGEKDVFLYVDNPSSVVGADPIEIFVQVNESKINDPENLNNTIAQKLAEWKAEVAFEHPLNLNVLPVMWYSKVGI